LTNQEPIGDRTLASKPHPTNVIPPKLVTLETDLEDIKVYGILDKELKRIEREAAE
jgi:DNA topoisomerase VI subunit B